MMNTYTQSLRTKLRRRIISEVGADPDLIADKYASRISESTKEYGSKREIRRELELMIRERLLVQTPHVVDGKTFDNISLPVYRLAGKIVSIREMVRHVLNIHNHPFDTIRYRLMQGLTPAQALAIPNVRRSQLRAAVEAFVRHETQCDNLP